MWFKVKTSDQRAIVTELRGTELPDGLPPGVGVWWIGAAGRRQADSPQRDFYVSIQARVHLWQTILTVHLLPVEWDWNRLGAEQAVAWRREMKRIVIRLIAMSLTTGRFAIAEFRNHRVKALVRADDGHMAYLTIIADGIPVPQVFALLIDCVPGVSTDDWQPEPTPLAAMEPAPGEIIWSTLLPSEVASAILELDANAAVFSAR
ncbi:MAG TPA: hypothetical protein VFZ63_04350 [Jiangellaceae bacterium]